MVRNAPAPGAVWVPKPRQQALLEALTTFPYPNLKDACTALDIPYGTGCNWHQDEHFSGALTELRQKKSGAIKDSLQMRLHGAGDEALEVIFIAMRQDDLKEATRAAEYLLDRILGRPGQPVDLTTGGKTVADLLYAISLPVPQLAPAPMADDSDL